jgi:hypothetical protein
MVMEACHPDAWMANVKATANPGVCVEGLCLPKLGKDQLALPVFETSKKQLNKGTRISQSQDAKAMKLEPKAMKL